MKPVYYSELLGFSYGSWITMCSLPLSPDFHDSQDYHGRKCVVCPWHKHSITLDTGESLYTAIDPSNLANLKPMSKGVKQVICGSNKVGVGVGGSAVCTVVVKIPGLPVTVGQ